jgi:hypothetical protein
VRKKVERLRHKLLADPTLTGDDGVEIAAGNLRHEASHLLNRRALPDEKLIDYAHTVKWDAAFCCDMRRTRIHPDRHSKDVLSLRLVDHPALRDSFYRYACSIAPGSGACSSRSIVSLVQIVEDLPPLRLMLCASPAPFNQ